jgi:hypothetical protein
MIKQEHAQNEQPQQNKNQRSINAGKRKTASLTDESKL